MPGRHLTCERREPGASSPINVSSPERLVREPTTLRFLTRNHSTDAECRFVTPERLHTEEGRSWFRLYDPVADVRVAGTHTGNMVFEGPVVPDSNAIADQGQLQFPLPGSYSSADATTSLPVPPIMGTSAMPPATSTLPSASNVAEKP